MRAAVGIDAIQIVEHRANRREHAVKIETVEGDSLSRIVDRPVVFAQPFDELEHFAIAPHPGRKPREGLPAVAVCRLRMPHVLIDAGGIGPIGLDGHEPERFAA